MDHAQQILFEKFSRLPLEKAGKALSYINFLEQEPENELYLDPVEEAELNGAKH